MVFLNIQLDNPQACYVAGERVSGKVWVAVSNNPLKCRGIRIHFYGCGYTEFKKGNVRYKTTAPYFDSMITLWGKQPGEPGDNPVLAVGDHSFPFFYDIPSGCPSTYDGVSSFGHIRYTCKAIVDNNWLDDTTTLPLHITGRNTSVLSFFADVLNAYCSMKEEAKAKTLGLACLSSGQLSATLKVPTTCYRAGDTIPFYAEIDNESSKEVIRCYVTLKTVTTYWAACGEKQTDRVTIDGSKVSCEDPIRPGGSKEWNGKIKIPEGVPVLGGTCSIISIDYKVVLSVVPKGPHFDLDLPLVVELGTAVRARLLSAE